MMPSEKQQRIELLSGCVFFLLSFHRNVWTIKKQFRQFHLLKFYVEKKRFFLENGNLGREEYKVAKIVGENVWGGNRLEYKTHETSYFIAYHRPIRFSLNTTVY